jgi:hypothetical protein
MAQVHNMNERNRYIMASMLVPMGKVFEVLAAELEIHLLAVDCFKYKGEIIQNDATPGS